MRGSNFGFMFLALVLTELPSRLLARCDLDCDNEGVCKEDETKGKYCHCRTGYSGNLCEIKFVVCDKGENGTCFNDTPCIRDIDADGDPYFHCQCDPANSDLTAPYATKFCEHAATAFCKPKDHNSVGPTGDSYCANSGKCNPPEKGKHHSGCLCAPGWSGVYCEVAEGVKGTKPQGTLSTPVSSTTVVASPTSAGGSRFKRFIVAFLSLFILLGSLACVGILFEHGRSGRRHVRQRYRRSRADEENEDEDEDAKVIAEQELTPTSSPTRSTPARSSGELA